MKKIFAFCNQKGGVGKTTSVINVAAVLAGMNHKVLVIDMDAQANCTSGLGQEKPAIESTTYQLLVENIHPNEIIRKTDFENLSIVPSSADLSGAEIELISRDRREYQLRSQMEKIVNDFDFIFLDCPPSLGLITINSLVACDCVIIPLQCEYYALEGLGQLLHTIQLVKSNLSPELEVGGVLLTMADFRTNLTQQVIEEVNGYFKEKVFRTIIPRSVKLSEAPSFGKPAVLYDPHNRGSKCYLEVGKEFAERFSMRHPAQDVSRETQGQETVSQPS
ncbi:MAG: AAA family ATPase [Candidatus Omnitrophota bacterium]|jgi:chromosome partitioning protein